MARRKLKRKTRNNFRRRRFRRNPICSIEDLAKPFPGGKGKVAAAREFLAFFQKIQSEQGCDFLSSETVNIILNDPHIISKIPVAESIVEKADLKNNRRKDNRAEEKGERLPSEIKATHWEEVLGPNGEVLRFKLLLDPNGVVLNRIRNETDKPRPGDLILDTTKGLNSWKIARNGKRRKFKVTTTMQSAYKGSMLYLARKFAAGELDIPQIIEKLSNIRNKPQKWKK